MRLKLLTNMRFLAWDENIIDRHGDRIIISGIDVRGFEKNPVIFFNHDRSYGHGEEIKSKVIGKATSVDKLDGKLFIDVEFDMNDEEAAEIARKCNEGFLNAVSIGFRTIEETDAMPYLPGQKYPTITKSELLEVSVVEIPAHSNAVRQKSYRIANPNIEEMEIKEITEKFKKLEETVQKQNEIIDAVKVENETLKTKAESLEKALSEVSEKKMPTLADIVDAMKNVGASGTSEDKSSWTFFDWKNKDPQGLEKIKANEPSKYVEISKRVK